MAKTKVVIVVKIKSTDLIQTLEGTGKSATEKK